MIKAEVIHPSRLRPADCDAWRTWRPRCSPLLGPDFAILVGELRPDARVAIIEADGQQAGFLAFHARPGGRARPIGAPFADYQAAAVRPGAQLTAGRALAAANVVAYRFTALVGDALEGAEGSQGFVIERGGDAYLKALDPKRVKNWRRLANKIERELGSMTLTVDDRDPEAFAQLLAWKGDQLRRSGLHDFLAARWSRTLLQTVFDRQTGPLTGRLMTLRAGGRLLAGHFGVEEEGVCHSWISSIDPMAHSCSPGQVILAQIILAMPEAGLTALDLGPSHGHYKAPFCTAQVATRQGIATAATPAGRLANAAEQAWRLAERAAPVCAAARRRLDQIAALELSAAGRAKGIVGAVAARARRVRAAAAEA